MKNVLLIGSYPPPYGGISIHIKRLTDILCSNGYRINILDITNVEYIKINENVTIIPLRVRYFIEIVKRFLSSDIVHIHTSGYGRYWREMLLIVFSKITNNKIIITVHGGLFPKHVSESSKISIYFLKLWFRYCDKIICVNKLQKIVFDQLISYKKLNEKIEIIPAFLPQQSTNNIVNVNNIKKEDGTYNLLVMGNWMELYGLHIFVRALKELIDSGIKVKGYVLAYIFSIPDKNYKHEVECLIEQMGLKDTVTFIPETVDTISIYKNMDVFIRPTYTDGDAVSVREALSVGTPVIASDVCERPNGTVLFKNADVSDLADKMKDVLNNLEHCMNNISKLDSKLYGEQLIDIYDKLDTAI